MALTASAMAWELGTNLTNSPECCNILQKAGLANVYLPGDETYAAQISSYWSVSVQLHPYCIVQPETTADVSTTITTLVEETNCKFAIRSGGHSSNPGANNIEKGVTIDLSRMNTTTLSPTGDTVSILPAARWGQVYQYLDAQNRGIPGGRLGAVGVGGLVTGGGLSFYVNRQGLVCDNVRNFEAVLASGEVVDANATHNRDLFTALKGGSSNFGVVTRIDIDTFPTSPIWGGERTYPVAQAEYFYPVMVDWTNNIEEYQNGSALVFLYHESLRNETLIHGVYTDVSGTVAAPAFDKFLAIPGHTSSNLGMTNMSTLSRASQAPGYRRRDVWFTVTFKNDERVIKKAVDLHNSLVEELKQESSDGDFIMQAFFQPFPTVIGKHSAEKGGNIAGIDAIDENAIVMLGSLAVNGADQEVMGREKMLAWKDVVEGYSESIGAGVSFRYSNYADRSQDVLRSYGEDNVRKMWDVSKKYDPEGVFQTRAPGGFRLPTDL
ncbi:uncharacterized protein K452DRAFT_327327 [Aplosporella prunicola CBS 121167]|uniref:FAD-binding PCMH-type domain-containing protein n=1 Tax=Aplosporella prunicola CBS 121167 TaxID=1176127 RepID=A0A6A6BD03_9PEZI|nr:uncharacterized protein K452DRAFT_327327 [Aplosporella prunicola CBS 121167]KAF2141094.1 hypothetical protein K452DRAFT_327327 [Aplosporella prunicola CBS 121167]